MDSPEFYAGWLSMQLGLMLKIYVKYEPQEFVNRYLSGLRPPIAACMVRDADDLFSPKVAGMVKQFKEEWNGAE